MSSELSRVLAVSVVLVLAGCSANAAPSASRPVDVETVASFTPPAATPEPTRDIPISLDVGVEALVADLPEAGDAWRWNLVEFEVGQAALPEGMTLPSFDPGLQLLAVRVEFTYVGTKPRVSVSRDDFTLLGAKFDSATSSWGADMYTYRRAGALPDEDWLEFPRDETHGYTLFYVVPTGFPFPSLMWNPNGGATSLLVWTYQGTL